MASNVIAAHAFVDQCIPCDLPGSVKDGEAARAAGLSLTEPGKSQTITIEPMQTQRTNR
jgi:hypothetical protein